ncbi:MAG TPA: putative LPS assembly protein LptD [Flavilitoribacter sp.]|nr:putative LPS assembly protein LptD [Flavilitoribacter sp.]HMQ88861.1 putative LPS assembly protein LptD [Flavilitoribacter sp.]
MGTNIPHSIFFFLLGCLPLAGQNPVILDTIPRPDSLNLAVDSLPPSPLLDPVLGIKLSKDSLDAPVEYNALDSMIYDIADEKIHLYGQAEVKYNTITLKAGHIIFDWKTNIVTAEGIPDSLGRMSELPEFADGDQTFTANRMRYNFQSRKGIVYDVKSQYNDIIVHGEKAKFISGEPPQDTSQKATDIIYNQDAIFTTCTAPVPHFGIRSRKQKLIPDKIVVVGPSNLEIMGVPTPLWLPFGFFPINKGRSTGLLFPNDYSYSEQWGYGLEGIGWFFPLGEHVNLSVRSNIYVKGTWGLSAESQYVKRYKYRGNFRVGFDVRRQENSDGSITRPRSFSVNWTHNQDRAAHPSILVGGSIRFQTNDYQRRVYNDAASVLENQINSNFSFSKNWTDKPLSLNVAFSHSQNTNSRQITVNFPVINFQTQTLYPFRSQKRGGKERWYESITLRYQGEAKSTFTGPDTTFFSQATLDEAQYGAKHEVSTGTSFKILKYFSLNPSASYREVWNFKSLEKNFIKEIDYDTIYNPATGEDEIKVNTYGYVESNTLPGFKAFRTYSAALSLNTQIFGTAKFRSGWLRGVRHVIKPSVSIGYAPDYLNEDLGYYRYVPTPRDTLVKTRYGIFDQGVYGSPPASGQQMALSYSINNIFEAKFWSKKDSTEKKMKLFDNIYINGNYNFAADSLKWSPVSMRGTTRFFKGATTLSASAIFDPLVREKDPTSGVIRRIDQTTWRAHGNLIEFVSADFSISTRMTVDKIRAIFQGKEEEVVEELPEEDEDFKRIEETDFLSLFGNFSISHTINFGLDRLPTGKDTLSITTNSIDMRGDIQLTKKWNIGVSRIGYDFVSKRLTYPYLTFSRDLHCWAMSMSWAPTRGTYQFSIRVKPGTLDFIKIPYERNNVDARRVF